MTQKTINTLTVLSVLVLASFMSPESRADSFGFRLKPQDYLYSPTQVQSDDLFDGMKPVDLGVDLAIGSDCGKINIEGTLRSTFNKVLSGDFFKGLVSTSIGAGPMLAACYFSPTWCSILKHTQLTANFLTQTRLNQCQIIDKYTDGRAEDYYRGRQQCTHQALQQNGGDMEAALESCGKGSFEANLTPWSGSGQSGVTDENRLIADSTKWAGFEGQEGENVTHLIQSLVGDTILSKGKIRVDYGPREHAYSPRTHLLNLEQKMNQELCGKLLPELATAADADHFINDPEIQRRMSAMGKPTGSSSGNDFAMLTPDLVRNLAYLPPIRRNRICLKLSQAMAMSTFTRDMNQSLDVLSIAAQNPNLPSNRKKEIESKHALLKNQIDITLKLHDEQTNPVGAVMQYIAQEGIKAQDLATRDTLAQESDTRSKRSHLERMNDCSDGIFCSSASSDGGVK